MRVATTFCDPCPKPIFQAMIRSVRQHMDCEIIQLTDLTTPKVDEVDSVQRLDGDIVSSFQLRHLAQLQGEILFIDYDTIVLEDVSHVFQQDFDIAITARCAREVALDRLLYKVCPHNGGVIFSRSPAFWQLAAERYDARTDDQSWFKHQIIITEAINALKQFKYLELASERYNHTPETRDEDLSGRAIVHYKGTKKSWMVNQKDEEAALLGNKLVEKMILNQKGVLTISKDHPNYETLSPGYETPPLLDYAHHNPPV